MKFFEYFFNFLKIEYLNIFALVIYHRVNCFNMVVAQSPFGGFKQSGFGREL